MPHRAMSCLSEAPRYGCESVAVVDGGRQEMVAPPELAEVGAVHAGSASGTREVAVVPTQELRDVSALPTYERAFLRRSKRQRVIERLSGSRWSDVAACLVRDRAPERRIAEQHRALHGRPELPDVTRPIVAGELVDQVLRCARMPGEPCLPRWCGLALAGCPPL